MTMPFKSLAKIDDADTKVEPLQNWIVDFVSALFPENGIEYWNKNEHSPRDLDLKPGGDFGFLFSGEFDKRLWHVACYFHKGNCEGRIIKVDVVDRKSQHFNVIWAKTFGTSDQTMAITGAITEAMEQIFLWRELPLITDLFRALPKRNSWDMKELAIQHVKIKVSGATVVATDTDGIILDSRDFTGDGDNARFPILAIIRDWETIIGLRNMTADIDMPKDWQTPAH